MSDMEDKVYELLLRVHDGDYDKSVDETLNEVHDYIVNIVNQEKQEAYKKGYIDGGINVITEGKS